MTKQWLVIIFVSHGEPFKVTYTVNAVANTITKIK
jgi:hypothetical protein